GQATAKSFYHHLCRTGKVSIRRPVLQGDMRMPCPGKTPGQRHIIHPQADIETVLICQLTGQAPTDADIAKVINDLAENIPAERTDIRNRHESCQKESNKKLRI